MKKLPHCKKKKCCITPWQEKIKTLIPIIDFCKNWPEKLMINFFWPY